MEDNLSITQHIIPNNLASYKPPSAPAIANSPAYKPYEYKPYEYKPSPYMPSPYMPSPYMQEPPIKNPLVGALIGLACIIVILIILLICSIMGLIKGVNSSDDSEGNSGGRNSGGRNSRGNNFKNKKNQNDPSGWQLYTLKGCGHCDKQLDNLPNFNTYIKYERGNPTPIVNNISGELYPREKINGFPLWYNSKTKEVKMGYQKDICNLNPKIKSENC